MSEAVNRNPLISVIIPVYNIEDFVGDCLASICEQTYKNLEIIAVDDGSKDGSLQVCNEYAQKDDRIVVVHKENGGLSSARNAGLLHAKGKYVSFIDGDDWIEKDMYETLIGLAERENADLVSSGMIADYQGHNYASVSRSALFKGNEIINALMNGKLNSTSACNKIYKREFFDNISFPEGKAFEDVLTIYRVTLPMKIAVVTDKAFYHYVQRENSINHNDSLNSLKNFWDAYLTRYNELANNDDLSESISDWRLLLLNNQSKAVFRVWRWIYKTYKQDKEKSASLSQEVSSFVKANYPLFGFKGMSAHLRFCVFMAHFNNTLSQAITCFAYLTIRKYMRKGNLLN